MTEPQDSGSPDDLETRIEDLVEKHVEEKLEDAELENKVVIELNEDWRDWCQN